MSQLFQPAVLRNIHTGRATSEELRGLTAALGVQSTEPILRVCGHLMGSNGDLWDFMVPWEISSEKSSSLENSLFNDFY